MIIIYVGTGQLTKANVIPVWRHYDEYFRTTIQNAE